MAKTAAEKKAEAKARAKAKAKAKLLRDKQEFAERKIQEMKDRLGLEEKEKKSFRLEDMPLSIKGIGPFK
jgi:hypothetical protein